MRRQAREVSQRVAVVVGDLKVHGIVGQPGAVLDVVDFMPEPLQADDVVNVLPDHAGDRAAGHEAHDDDAFAFHRVVGRFGRKTAHCFTITAGLPATTTFGGTLFVTTAPAATTEFSPMVTPFKMIAFMPIQTLS